jgi:hypothetical protein
MTEQLPLIFPEPFPVPWPTGSVSLLMALKECKRRRQQKSEGE